jgi:hypothetical protein
LSLPLDRGRDSSSKPIPQKKFASGFRFSLIAVSRLP